MDQQTDVDGSDGESYEDYSTSEITSPVHPVTKYMKHCSPYFCDKGSQIHTFDSGIDSMPTTSLNPPSESGDVSVLEACTELENDLEKLQINDNSHTDESASNLNHLTPSLENELIKCAIEKCERTLRPCEWSNTLLEQVYRRDDEGNT